MRFTRLAADLERSRDGLTEKECHPPHPGSHFRHPVRHTLLDRDGVLDDDLAVRQHAAIPATHDGGIAAVQPCLLPCHRAGVARPDRHHYDLRPDGTRWIGGVYPHVLIGATMRPDGSASWSEAHVTRRGRPPVAVAMPTEEDEPGEAPHRPEEPTLPFRSHFPGTQIDT